MSLRHNLVFWSLPVIYLGIVIWFATKPGEMPMSNSLTVVGDSMAPALRPGDSVRLDASPETALQRGDLVAIKFSTRERKMLKRIIALPGDKVKFIDGRLQS